LSSFIVIVIDLSVKKYIEKANLTMEFPGRSKLLGEYQLGKTIGQGAFSKVKLGYHRESGQKVGYAYLNVSLPPDAV
jgi:hypothetical protein